MVLLIGLVTASLAGEALGLATALVASTDPLLLFESTAPRADVVGALLSVVTLGVFFVLFRNYRQAEGREPGIPPGGLSSCFVRLVR